MDRSRRRLFSVALKAIILLSGVLGQAFSFSRNGFLSGRHFLYYTNISNLLVILLSAVLMTLELRAPRGGAALILPGWLSDVRFALSAGILLTFAVFSLLLMPRMSLDYISSPANLLVHNLVPLLASLDFVLFDSGRGEKRSLLPGLALPMAYFLFAMGMMRLGVRFGDAAAPYFFLDYAANGWFTAGDGKLGVFWWLLILCAITLLQARLLLWLRGLAVRRFRDG